MKCGYRLFSSTFFVTLAVVATACSAGDNTFHQHHSTSPVISIMPCSVAFAPHRGVSAIDQTIVQLQEKSRQREKSVVILERLGWAFVAKARESYDHGFYHLAEQTASCMASKQGDSHAVLLLRGHVLHNLHRFREAEKVARHLVARRGLWFDYGLLGDVLMEQGQLQEAVVAYQRMMDQKPGPLAYSRAAHLRWLKGDLAGAIDAMTWAVRATHRTTETGAWMATHLAFYEMQAGGLEKARSYLEQTLQQRPDYAPALLAKGRWLLAKNHYQEAIIPLTRAVALNPLPGYRWVLIEALQAAGEDTGPHVTQLHQRGATDDARSYALYLATTGDDPALAVKLMAEELKNRADVFTLDAYAWALLSKGRPSQAQQVMRRALTQGTKEARLFLHAGIIAQRAGDKEAAIDWLCKADRIKQMLLPSERALLSNAFAVVSPQIKPLAGQ